MSTGGHTMSNLKTEHEIEIDKIHDRQLAEKDAEIERLELDLSNALGDGQDKDTEIERLKAEIERQKGVEDELGRMLFKVIPEKDQLITELCDALQKANPTDRHKPLILRAREATR